MFNQACAHTFSYNIHTHVHKHMIIATWASSVYGFVPWVH